MAENKMEQYCKLPIPITAYQTDKEVDIETLEGTHHANIGDWIITDVKGEQYPCKPDIFEKTYIKCGQPNKVEQVATMFGKKLNEEFTIKYSDNYYKACFWSRGIKVHALYCDFWDTVFVGLIIGTVKIVNE